jgi:hypothetical protein
MAIGDWYYSEDKGSYGPFALDALKLALHARPHYYDVLVWRTGLPKRRPATEVPELQYLDVVDGKVVFRGPYRQAPAVNWNRLLSLPVLIAVLYFVGTHLPPSVWAYLQHLPPSVFAPIFWPIVISLGLLLYFRVRSYLWPVLGLSIAQCSFTFILMLEQRYYKKGDLPLVWYTVSAENVVFACLIVWAFVAKSRASLVALLIYQLIDSAIALVVLFDPNAQTTYIVFGLGVRLVIIGSTIYALFKLPKTTTVGTGGVTLRKKGMNFLFGIERPYPWWKVILFYVSHGIIAVAIGGLLGGAWSFFTESYYGDRQTGYTAGWLVAILYSGLLTVLVVNRRNLEGKYYGWLVVTIPVAALLAAFGGMIVPAFLTTRTNATKAGVMSRKEGVTDFLFGIERPYVWWKAILFYISHALVVVAMGGILGGIFGIFVETHYGIMDSGYSTGTIVAIIYCTMLTIQVVNQRKLGWKYGALFLTGLAAFYLGALGGVIVSAFLTTRANAGGGVEVVKVA